MKVTTEHLHWTAKVIDDMSAEYVDSFCLVYLIITNPLF